jgi:DNA topoisomerase-1
MRIAQQLYEGVSLGPEGTTGLITYMRTDSTQVASEAQMAARDVIKERFGSDYLPDKPPFYAKKAKGAQEAHEAIRPTKPGRLPEAVKAYLSPGQFRLYQLIWRRFVASQMAPARLEQTTVDIEARPQANRTPPEAYPFRASGERVIFPGFLAVYREGQGDSEEEDEANPAANREGGLPRLEAGNPLDLLKLLPEQRFTEPPPRFGEASLIKALEELGVGRPSTYATIMSTIRDRGYVVELKEGKERKFHPTALGRAVNDLLVARFPDLLDVQFTARLEGGLDEVAEGKLAWTPLVASVYGPMMEQLARAEREVGKIEVPAETLPVPEKPAGRSYTGSGGGRGSYKRASRSKYGAAAGSPETAANSKPWEPTTPRTRRTSKAVPTEAAPRKPAARRKAAANAGPAENSVGTASPTGETCPLCQKPMVRRKGPYGEFMGCTGYPNCKGTRKF